MRIAVITDVHGNLGALRAVLADLNRSEPDEVIFGGDVALFGSHGRECWQHVLDMNWRTVQGNTDRYLADPESKLQALRSTSPLAAEQLERNLAWGRAQIGDALIARMASMPTIVRIGSPAGKLVVVHGAPGNDEVGLNPDTTDSHLSQTIGTVDSAALVCGHTHRAFVRHVARMLIVNCGSVGRSYDGHPGQATYALLDDDAGRWAATIRQISYDHQKAHRQLKASGAPISPSIGNALLTALAPAE